MGSDLEAVDEYRKAIAHDPNLPAKKLIWLSVAGILKDAKRYEEAVEAYQEVLDIDSTHADAQMGIADCHVFLDNRHEAEKAFRKAIDLAPENPSPHVYLAMIYTNTHRPLDAVSAHCKAASLYLKRKA